MNLGLNDILISPASNGFVEHPTMKILDGLRPVVCALLQTWKDWPPPVAANSISESTCKSSHYMLFGVEKKLPYDLFSSLCVLDYVKCQLRVFSEIYLSVKSKLRATKTAMCEQQQLRASPVTLQ